MDSSVALGRLELARPVTTRGSCLPEGAQGAHLNGCVPLSHQVAGHKYGVDKVGILQHPDGTVLKQLQPPPRGPREMQFYSMVYAEDHCDPCLVDLQAQLPKYYGTWSSQDAPTDLYLKLEDVTRRFQKPCIMDVKIGQKSYDPFASQEKREQQIRKYPLMEEIGFLVLGMRVYKVGLDSFDTYDQHYGRGLVKDTITEVMNNILIVLQVYPSSSTTATFFAKTPSLPAFSKSRRSFSGLRARVGSTFMQALCSSSTRASVRPVLSPRAFGIARSHPRPVSRTTTSIRASLRYTPCTRKAGPGATTKPNRTTAFGAPHSSPKATAAWQDWKRTGRRARAKRDRKRSVTWR
ncbi:inositol polyphosphate multikinase-like isoform X3 [Sinocyclocheilus anshuiensis]|uniref:inositol polyphosphate multikinase-like isoform X3 n=1 Tax=Sinocyclocheilus anshuiensis TaxID=1608454 RepID=UPI0007B90315|nr:PREDICTED: inositol polyphosphate multikinase-like isoform X3 [Sinocyclocheilus anshuiensis]